MRSVAELKAAAEAGKVRGVKGFGEKTEKKILDGIAQLEARGQTLLLPEALRAGEAGGVVAGGAGVGGNKRS